MDDPGDTDVGIAPARVQCPHSAMRPPSRFAIIVAFAAVYVIWGSTYLGILFAIRSIPPLLMAGSRFLFAGVILYFASRLSGAGRSTMAEWRTALIVGTCLLVCGNGGVTLAEQYVPSGLAALLVATVPLYIALLSWLFGLSERPRPLAVLGLAGGFVGVAVLIGPALWTETNSSPQAWIGMSILLCSSLIWSAGSLYSRRAPGAASPFLAAGQQMLCGGTALLLAACARGELRHFQPRQISLVSFGAFVYLVLIGAIIGYVAYAWLLRHCDPAKVATYAYVNPVVAVILGAAFADEKLTLMTILAATIIIGSVALVITAG
ncbi:MAG TPA: EamA family transporter, partial [Chthoniobacterales bacterium]|nr:EamA family transporter [Chthoniobacterales bacterium]